MSSTAHHQTIWISQTNSNIIEYLIQKLESKTKHLAYQTNMVLNGNNFESWLLQKKKILNFFNDIEDNLKQASCAIKAWLTENRSITYANNKSNEMLKETINELKRNNHWWLVENENLKYQINQMNNNVDVNDWCTTNMQNESGKSNNNKNSELVYHCSKNSNLSNVRDIINNIKKNKDEVRKVVKRHFNGSDDKEETRMSGGSRREQRKQEIWTRIMSSPENVNILSKKIGHNFMNRLLSPDCSDEYIDKVETILLQKEREEGEQTYYNDTIPIRIRNKIESKSKSKEKNKKRSWSNSFTSCRSSRSSNVRKDFVKSLREYPCPNNIRINQHKPRNEQ